MSQFSLLQRKWPAVFEAASKAEAAVHADPRTACFYARRALELAVSWAYKHDAALRLPYQDNLSALIHEPSFKQTAGEAVFRKARVINTLGNRAVHNHRAVPEADAQQRRFVCCCAPLTAGISPCPTGLHSARAVLHSTRRSNGNTSRESREYCQKVWK
jgi:hypothetical protein